MEYSVLKLMIYSKATDIEAAVKGLREGTVDPDKIKIEGIETEEEKKKKEVCYSSIISLQSLNFSFYLLG